MLIRSRRECGVSLLEVMVVIAIIGMLGAVAIPQIASHKADGKAAALSASLFTLRTAIDAYWAQHDGFPAPDAATVAEQLLKRTNKAGRTGLTDEYCFGPYLRESEIPENPLTGTASLNVVAEMPNEPSGNQAWIYCFKTGEIRANALGKAPDGSPYFEL